MTQARTVAYFPVLPAEQKVLERLRQSDLSHRLGDVAEMLDALAEAETTPADLEQALALLAESRDAEGLDARFENLEARFTARIDSALTEMEGRLSKRLDGGAPGAASQEASPAPSPPESALPRKPEIPKEASLAFRIDGDLVWGKTAAAFYTNVWKWLFDHGHVTLSDLPIASSKRRYIAATKPVHPSGKKFFRPERIHGAYVETNAGRKQIVERAKKYLKQWNVPFEILIGAKA